MPEFVPLVQRSGLSMRAWTAIRNHLREQMGEREGKEAVQWLEDYCGEVYSAAAGAFESQEGQDAFESLTTARMAALFAKVKVEGRYEAWQPALDLALPYLYTCLADLPRLGEVFLSHVGPDLERLGVDLAATDAPEAK